MSLLKVKKRRYLIPRNLFNSTYMGTKHWPRQLFDTFGTITSRERCWSEGPFLDRSHNSAYKESAKQILEYELQNITEHQFIQNKGDIVSRRTAVHIKKRPARKSIWPITWFNLLALRGTEVKSANGQCYIVCSDQSSRFIGNNLWAEETQGKVSVKNVCTTSCYL